MNLPAKLPNQHYKKYVIKTTLVTLKIVKTQFNFKDMLLFLVTLHQMNVIKIKTLPQ